MPTRDILEDEQVDEMRTALRAADANGVTQNVTYGEFCKLAAAHAQATAPHPKFYWLWRSGLKDYDRQSRAWQRWINRLFTWTPQYRRRKLQGWRGGFGPYDELATGKLGSVTKFDSFLEFARMCDLLISELRESSLPD